jgi:hypothetical protein
MNISVNYQNMSFAYEQVKLKRVMKDVSYEDKIFKKGSEIKLISLIRENFISFESTRSLSLSWLSKKSNFFINTLNKFLMEAEQHGFTQYFQDSKFKDLPPTSKNLKPKVLTMQMLSAGFIVWLGSVVVACFVFVIELLIAHKSRKSQKSIVKKKYKKTKSVKHKILLVKPKEAQ